LSFVMLVLNGCYNLVPAYITEYSIALKLRSPRLQGFYFTWIYIYCIGNIVGKLVSRSGLNLRIEEGNKEML